MISPNIKPYGLVEDYAHKQPMTPEESHARHDADKAARHRTRLRRTYATILAATGIFAAAKTGPEIVHGVTSSVDNLVQSALHTGNDTFEATGSDVETITFSGFIESGAHVRTDPWVEEGTDNNICVVASDALTISGLHAIVTESRGDGNGRWLGFNSNDLPATIQAGCENDADSLVWVTENNTLSLNP